MPSSDRLHVVTAGDGRPVVLLHGLTATHRYVVMGSQHLERAGHRVIAYDARGHGALGPGAEPGAYGYADLVADLLAVLDDAGMDRAVLAGASMGAHTALRCALEWPERVAGLVAVTPAYEPATARTGRSPRWDRAGRRACAGRGGRVRRRLRPRRGARGLPRDRRDRAAPAPGPARAPAAVAEALRVVPRSRPFPGLGELAAIAVPTVVVGDRDEADPGHPLAVAEAYARAIPGAELVVEEPGRSPIAWQGGQLSPRGRGASRRARPGTRRRGPPGRAPAPTRPGTPPPGCRPGSRGTSAGPARSPGRPSSSGRRSPTVSRTRSVAPIWRSAAVGSSPPITPSAASASTWSSLAGRPARSSARRCAVIAWYFHVRAHVGDREVGAGRVERGGAAERPHRLGPEVQRAPGQAAPEVLELGVAPALGLADGVGAVRGVQRRRRAPAARGARGWRASRGPARRRP